MFPLIRRELKSKLLDWALKPESAETAVPTHYLSRYICEILPLSLLQSA